MNRIRPSLRIALWFAISLQVVLLIVRLVLELLLLGSASPPRSGIVAVVAEVFAMAVFLVVGIVIFRRQPANPMGWLFCVVNVGLISNMAVRSYVQLGMVGDPGSLPAPEVVAWLYTWPGLASFAFYALLLMLFPDGRFLSDRWRLLGGATIALMGFAGVLAAIAPGPLDPSMGLVVSNPFGLQDPVAGPLVYELSTWGYPVGILLLLAGIYSTVRRYRSAAGVERLQLKWFVSGAVTWALLLAAFLAIALRYPSWDFPLWARVVELVAHLGAGVFPVAAGVAILRYRLYEIDRIISRTVSYAIVTVVLVGIYVAGVLGVGGVVRGMTGGGGGDLVVAASTLAVAAAFGPLRRRVQALVDRRFNRARYDAQQTVEAFGQRLRDEIDLDTLAGQLRSTATATMHPRAVSVWLRAGEPGS
jgi:hypothetical protein